MPTPSTFNLQTKVLTLNPSFLYKGYGRRTMVVTGVTVVVPPLLAPGRLPRKMWVQAI